MVVKETGTIENTIGLAVSFLPMIIQAMKLDKAILQEIYEDVVQEIALQLLQKNIPLENVQESRETIRQIIQCASRGLYRVLRNYGFRRKAKTYQYIYTLYDEER